MVSFTVRLKFASDDCADVRETLRLLAAASREEPGCVSYIPHSVEGDPETFLIYEQYRDEKALAAHRASAHFKISRASASMDWPCWAALLRKRALVASSKRRTVMLAMSQ